MQSFPKWLICFLHFPAPVFHFWSPSFLWLPSSSVRRPLPICPQKPEVPGGELLALCLGAGRHSGQPGRDQSECVGLFGKQVQFVKTRVSAFRGDCVLCFPLGIWEQGQWRCHRPFSVLPLLPGFSGLLRCSVRSFQPFSLQMSFGCCFSTNSYTFISFAVIRVESQDRELRFSFILLSVWTAVVTAGAPGAGVWWPGSGLSNGVPSQG